MTEESINTPLRHSVATRLIKLVFAFYCVVAVVITAIQIIMEYQYTKSSIQQELAINQAQFAPVLAPSVWDLDRQQIQNTLNGMLANPIVKGVKLLQQGKLLAASGLIKHDEQLRRFDQDGIEIKVKQGSPSQSISYAFDLNYEFRQQSRTIGQVEVYSNTSAVIQRVEVGIILLIINAIIKTIALWWLFYWVGQRILIRPLQRLVDALTSVKLHQLEQVQIDLKGGESNEFAIIESAFNDMITDLRQTRRQLLDMQQHLELTVKERTQSLTSAKHAAEQANQAKSQFMSRVSHELNTPLNAIVAGAQLLEQRVQTHESDTQVLVTNILAAGRHLHLLINDILDLVQNESNQLQLIIVPCDLRKAMKECLAMVAPEAEKKQIHWQYEFGTWHVFADEARLSQVLVHLLDNAIRYNLVGGTISVSVIELEQGLVDIRIKDSGIGIAGSDMEKIFAPLTRLPYAEENCIDGIGNGLALVRVLVEKMHGKVWIATSDEAETEFCVQLRACKKTNTET